MSDVEVDGVEVEDIQSSFSKSYNKKNLSVSAKRDSASVDGEKSKHKESP